MAQALVVYESVFGNARRIAEAVADGLGARFDVVVVAAPEAGTEVKPDVELLVVGGPNHAFSMPRESTRRGAVEQHGAVVADPTTGLHEWLDAVRLPAGIRAAAFDTRMTHPRPVVAMDHASRTEEKLLRRLGATLVADAEHFRVTDVQGPLAAGEEERARAWGAALAQKPATRSS